MTKFAGSGLNLAPLTVVMVVVVALMAVNQWDIVQADPDNDIIVSRIKMLTDAFHEKCSNKKVFTTKEFKELSTECIEPILKAAKFIPSKFYPQKYQQLVSECFYKSPETTNTCDLTVQKTQGKCLEDLEENVIEEFHKLLEEKKPEFAKILDEGVTKCLPNFVA